MNRKTYYFLLFATMLCFQGIMAQGKTVSGNVTDDTGAPLPGVNVLEKGTTNGTATDFDGNYTINVTGVSAALEFSYLGFTKQEIVVGNQSTINVSLAEDAEQLGEVVVTALGIKKEKKAIGYAVQELKGSELMETREDNIANAITGKVAGLQVVRGSNGPAGSSKIVLRGNNSLTGDNQPLIVVDGVPLDNFTGASNNDFFNPSQDMGNGLGDINPDDVESMTVLKGASAAALYGSRAGNGVILITTKKGATRKGLGITFSSTTGFESIFMKPELQGSFGQGSEGIYDDKSTLSWGPKIEGQTITDWKGDQVQMRAYDNIGNYYTGGISQNYSLSFQQQASESTSLYTSLNYLDDDSNIPGTSYKRFNLTTRAVSNFGPDKKWTTDMKVQYINSKANNRPLNGANVNNAYSTVATLPRSIDIREFQNSTDEFGKSVWYLSSNSINPYWAAEYNLSEDRRDRYLLNGSLNYKITDWISAEVKGGADMYTNNEEKKLYGGSPLTNTGRYSLGKDTFIEQNYSMLVTGSKSNIVGDFGISFTAGGNLMSQRREGISGSAGELEVPDLFSLNNGINSPSVGQSFSQRKINSVFGSFGVDYNGLIFVDVTGRNDWTSTLSQENQSFFYPSINTSFVFSELFNTLPEWWSFGKIRASYAEVGNDLDPYQLINTYSIGHDVNGNTTAGTGNTLNNPNLKNELIKSSEIGFEGRFFQNRLAIDFAWYKSNATNQLLAIPLDPFSGYNSLRVNAGNVQNKGIELTINADIIENPEGFSWSANLNYSKNDNTIQELINDVTQFQLGGYDNLAVLAVVNGGYGEIWGTKFRRVQDESDPNFGKMIVDGNGLPLAEPDREQFYLGNQNPDALLGFSNTFTYKNISFGFLVDARLGGEIFSGTNLALQESGSASATVVNGQRNNITVDAVVDDGSGNYSPNTVAVSPQQYWNAVANVSGNLGISEANVYDATNIRLRNVSLDYLIPSKWLNNTGIQRAKFGVSANNVWMIDSHLNGVDPESVFATGGNATGFENLSPPTSRTVFFNVSINF